MNRRSLLLGCLGILLAPAAVLAKPKRKKYSLPLTDEEKKIYRLVENCRAKHRVWKEQEMFFRNGIFPRVKVVMRKDG
jgi:hypothetical protein